MPRRDAYSKPRKNQPTWEPTHTVPEGMSVATFASHPVRQLLRNSAYFGERAIPTAADLAELELPQHVTAEIDMVARRLAAIHETGNHQRAWSEVDAAAADILADLTPRDREPAARRSEQPDPYADLTPAQLADLVPRYVSGSTGWQPASWSSGGNAAPSSTEDPAAA